MNTLNAHVRVYLQKGNERQREKYVLFHLVTEKEYNLKEAVNTEEERLL